MLTFYKINSDPFTDRIEGKLEEMVIAHKIIQVDHITDLPGHIDDRPPPILCDNHQIWVSKQAITAYLNTLHQEIKLGRSLQSDSCHLDPDNPEECL